MAPSIQIMPTLGSYVYRYYLLWAIWMSRDLSELVTLVIPIYQQATDSSSGVWSHRLAITEAVARVNCEQMSTYLHAYICTCICMYVYMHVYEYICIHIYMYIYIYVYVDNLHLYIHIRIKATSTAKGP